MDKSPEAFRTISEVAETLETPAHVLRFWESRFPQIKPVKRAGGRRYYRPADVALLSGIRHLLHDEGMTIRGVQKILREQGVRHVASMALGGDIDAFDVDLETEDPLFDGVIDADGAEESEPGTAEVVALDTGLRQPTAAPDLPAEIVQLRAAPDPEGIPMAAPSAPLVRSPGPPEDDAPEAGHVWVDDEPEMDLTAPAPLFPVAASPAVLAPAQPPPAVPPEMPHDAPAPKLSGIAARLRALPRPASPGAVVELTELHSRIGLLHAQIAEALRARK